LRDGNRTLFGHRDRLPGNSEVCYLFRLQQLIDVTLNFCYNPACDSIIANQENAATLLNPAQ